VEPVAEMREIDPKAEYQAFQSYWRNSHPHSPIPTVYSQMFGAWLAGVRSVASLARPAPEQAPDHANCAVGEAEASTLPGEVVKGVIERAQQIIPEYQVNWHAAAYQALSGIDDDYMTSERHHPGYVLIPTAKFEQLCAAMPDATPPTTPAVESGEEVRMSVSIDLDAAWAAYQNTPIDLCADSDDETRKCVENAVRAAIAAIRPAVERGEAETVGLQIAERIRQELCTTNDEAGYQRVTSGTEHIAELKRIQAERAALNPSARSE
jgi:hypothetical protein